MATSASTVSSATPINHVTAIAQGVLPSECYRAVCVGKALGPFGLNSKRMSHSLGTL